MKQNEGNYRLTFSQREGLAPLPEAMRPKHVSKDFRNMVWFILDRTVDRETNHFGEYYSNSSMSAIVLSYCLMILKWTHDHIVHSPSQHKKLLKQTILEGSFDQVLSFIEFVLRHSRCTPELREVLGKVFQDSQLAYNVQTIDDLPTVVPRFSEESSTATQQAIGIVEEKGPSGARAHLRNAARAINENRNADAVRESIHAVESVVRTIDPKEGSTLGSALGSLEKVGVLDHPALKDAFLKLYGYTNDKNGIRHALLEEGTADVDSTDAVFMFGACACFAAYLIEKNQNVHG